GVAAIHDSRFTIHAPAPAAGQTAIRVVVDGSPVRLDQPPVMVGGRVLVPLRGVFEKIGALVEWKPISRTAIILRPGVYVELRVGGRTATVSGTRVRLDTPARIIRGRVLVPLRFVSEAMGVHVLWRASDRTVVISTQTAGPVRGQVAITASASGYAVGQPIAVSIANGTTGTVYSHDSKTDCSIVELERRSSAGWETVTGCRFGRPPLVVEIKPGQRMTVTIDPRSSHLVFEPGQLGFAAGIYRVKFSYSFTRSLSGVEPEIAYSSEFRVR
ncbi:MAG TPA: copper amine oxidase N-terminal domain-containing protein, partial [bacterium]